MTGFDCKHSLRPELGRRSFMTCTAVAAGVAATGGFAAARTKSPKDNAPVPTQPAGDTAVPIQVLEEKRKFMEEAAALATESVEKGWGGPFGAVIVKDGKVIGRGQNRVLLTGCPVYHAEITAIMDASQRLNPKALHGSDYGAGTILEMIPREPGSRILSPSAPRC